MHRVASLASASRPWLSSRIHHGAVRAAVSKEAASRTLQRASFHALTASRRPVSAAPIAQAMPVRWFWWNAKDSSGRDGKAASSAGESEDGQAGGGVDSGAGGSANSGNNGSDSDSDGSVPGAVAVADSSSGVSRIAQGDNAPRPDTVIAVPIPRRPLFPGFMIPLTIHDEATIEALVSLRRGLRPYVGCFMAKESDIEGDDLFPLTSAENVHEVGTLAHISHIVPLPGGVQAMFMAHRRISLLGEVEGTSPLEVRVSHHDQPPIGRHSDIVKAYSNEILTTLREVIKINPMFKEHVQYFTQRLDVQDVYKLADFSAALTTADGDELQKVLEATTIVERLKGALMLLKQELVSSKLQQDISKQVEEKMAKNQRQYFLQEQLKSIKKELGLEKDDKEALLQKFRERLEGVEVPEHAKKVIDEEMEKLSSLEKNSSEYNVTRTYLDWLTSLPWDKHSEENFDIARAQEILDEDHYGMKDMKDRILEFIAVGNLKGSVQGRIICMVGPPGVGKTSIGKSIARALNREFYRFSVGGLSDVAEIKGHRRTYVGAMPGKVIQCLKTTGVTNPLILIDEIDKLGRGYQGDPASALLEMLDPNQNSQFMDHYLDVPVDCSKILFLCTANVIDTIPGPLLDRMEVIRLSGYDGPEKLEIAKRYLDPKARSETGLEKDAEHTPKSLELKDSAIDGLVRWYCRESGVRNLEQKITKIFQKLALKVVNATPEERAERDWAVTEDNLVDYVGKRVYTSDRMYETTPPGVVMGLAWTSMGGSTLYVEATSPNFSFDVQDPHVESKSKSKDKDGNDAESKDEPAAGGGLRITGQLGDVMQESAQIALSFSRHKLRSLDPTNKFFERASIHVHVPEGATPKDGPSAGCTLATALLSLALNKPVRADLAMTGELSLTGKVLPVGGIKEKAMAAKRSGVKVLVLPDANRKDYEELPDYVQEGLEVHYAKQFDEVFAVALDHDSKSDAN